MFESREFIMNQATLQRSCPGKTVRHFPLTVLIVIGSLYLYKKSLKSFFPFQAFLKLYIGKRYFLNGWAGFFAAKTQSFYAFLKYAKLLEADRKREVQPFE